MGNEKEKVQVDTIIRTVTLFIALANQILVAFGKSPIPVEEESVALLISTGVTVVAGLWAWWKNNNFSQAALKAQKVLNAEKAKG